MKIENRKDTNIYWEFDYYQHRHARTHAHIQYIKFTLNKGLNCRKIIIFIYLFHNTHLYINANIIYFILIL